MNKIFNEYIESSLTSLDFCRKDILNAIKVSQFFNNVNIEDVVSLNIGHNYYTEIPTVTLYVAKKDSKIVHEIAQKLDMKFNKNLTYNNEGIVYEGELFKEGVKVLEVKIYGVLPETCRVEYEEIPLPEDEIKKTRKVAKVICND